MTRLDDLAGERVGRWRLAIVEWHPAKYTERYHVALGLEGEDAPSGPILSGVYHAGTPERHLPAWLDATYGGTAEGAEGVRVPLRECEVEDPLFTILGTAIPPNGWLALAYETLGVDTALLRETRRLLSLGAPPIVTPLGLLLHRAGCGWHIRDWYIAEGWREGPRKLQGYKPAHAESERRRKAETGEALRRFLARASDRPELAVAGEVAERLVEDAS